MPEGTIRRLMDRGYGFIKVEQGEDLFFHSNDVDGAEFNSLKEGQEVEFETGQGRDGRPQAKSVRLVEIQASTNDGDDQEAADDQDEYNQDEDDKTADDQEIADVKDEDDMD